MALVALQPQPGICKSQSPYAAGKQGNGRYIDGDHVRFVTGNAEKIGGWSKATSTRMTGVPRCMTDFRDSGSTPCLAIGTESHLYDYDGTTRTLQDITPLRTITTGTLTDVITTSAGLKLVAVADATQNLQNGDHVFLQATTAVGGVTFNGWYLVSSRTALGYNITIPVAAVSSAGPLGGVTVFQYPRRLTGVDPFATVSGQSIVTVTDATHGAATNDYVMFSGATDVAGLSFNREFRLTVIDGSTFTIDAGSPANATTTGGGAAVAVAYDIFVPSEDDLVGTAYGVGPYGIGPYGKIPSTVSNSGTGWTLAAYGSLLLAAPIGGTIYVYDSSTMARAYPLLNAPATVLAIFVTPERFLFALGINGNPMQIAWPDQSDITNWTTLPTNTANAGRSFQGGTTFVAGIPVANGVSLFWSNRSVFQASYTGDNEVYNTPLVSDLCGLIGPQASTTSGGVAYWMSDHDFWTWNGTVLPMDSGDIRDYVFQNINTSQQSKCFARSNRAKKEIWFYYPSASSNEIDRYVIAHLDQPGAWSIGTIDRTCGHDSDLFTQPYGTNAAGALFIEESGKNADGAAIDSFVEFAPVDVSSGDRNLDVFGFIPDFSNLVGNAALTVLVKQYPQDTAQAAGPFLIADNDTTPLLDFRADGKMVGYRLRSNVLNGDYRFGVARANVQPSGARL